MRKLMLLGAALCAACCMLAQEAAPEKFIVGKVRPQMLNVRIQPVANAGVVDKLPRNSEVKVVKVEGAWYKIMLPATADAYVSADFLKDSKTVTRVQMRYGAGVAFHSYGVIPAGTQVKILNNTNSKWTKIEPPAGFYGYVSSEFVAVADSDYQKLVGVKDAVPPSKRDVDIPTVNTADMAEISGRFERMRPFVTGAPADLTISGEVQKTDSANTGATHALIKRDNGKIVTLAALYHGKVKWEDFANAEKPVALAESAVDLNKFVGKNVKITGKKLSIVSWSYPYIVVEKVTAE